MLQGKLFFGRLLNRPRHGRASRLLAFVALCLLFFFLRFGNVLTAVERVSYADELDAGTIAKELLEGLKLPLLDYQVVQRFINFEPGFEICR